MGQLPPENLLQTGKAKLRLRSTWGFMLWTIVAILIVLWLLGWAFHVAGSMIHLLLVIAIIVALISLVGGRKTT